MVLSVKSSTICAYNFTVPVGERNEEILSGSCGAKRQEGLGLSNSQVR